MSPRISIVVIALNEEQALPGLLDDLRPMREAGHEIIVVDGGSRDATRTLARAGADQVLCCPPGRARQSNAGARVAHGRLLWFLHADSRVSGAVRQAFDGFVEPGWGRFDVVIRAEGGQRACRLALRGIAWAMNLRSRLSGIATGDQGIFVSREWFDRVGGFPEQPLMEDIALSRALKRRVSPQCLRGPLSTSGRRWCQRGVVRTVVLMWGLRLGYWLGVSPRILASWYR